LKHYASKKILLILSYKYLKGTNFRGDIISRLENLISRTADFVKFRGDL